MASIKTYTPREIGGAINNAVLLASQPEGFDILEGRLRKLSEYSAALVEPVQEAVLDKLLDYREAVICLLSSALIILANNNVGLDKVPLFNLAKQTQKKG